MKEPKDLSQKRLDVLLKEYDNLRTEIRETIKLHYQLYTILISAIGVSFGYAFVNKTYDVFMVMPMISFAFLYRWLWDQNTILAISYYVTIEVEKKKIPMLIGYVENISEDNYKRYWIGWNRFWIENMLNKPIPRLHIYTVFLVFTLPVVLSLVPTFLHFQSISPFRFPITGIDWILALRIAANSVYVGLLTHVIYLYKRLHSFYVKLYEESESSARRERGG